MNEGGNNGRRKGQTADVSHAVRALKHLSMLEPFNAILYFNTLKPAITERILTSLIGCRPPLVDYDPGPVFRYTYYWMVRCICKSLDYSVEVDVFPLLFSYLRRLKNTNINTIKKSLENITRPPEIAFRECSQIISLSIEDRPLFEALRPGLLPVIVAAGKDELIQKHGLLAFPLLTPGSLNMIDGRELLNIQPIDFFSLPNSYISTRMSFNFQKAIINQAPFPRTPVCFEKNWMLSLIGTVIINEKYMLDIVIDEVIKFLENNQLQNALNILDTFSLKQWSALIIVSKYKENKNFLSTFLASLPRYDNDDVGSDYLYRFSNQLEFMKILHRFTGQLFNENEFAESSLPYMLGKMLTKIDLAFYDFFSKKPLLCINDNDRNVDSCFIWSFFAIVSILKIVRNPQNLDRYLESFESAISHVNNSDILQNIIVDIFSLIFIKKDNIYLLSAAVIEKILSTLVSYAESKIKTYVSTGFKKVQISRMIGSNGLAGALIPLRDEFCAALLKNDLQIAKHIAETNDDLQKILNTYIEIQKYNSTPQHFGYNPDSSIPMVAAEIGLCLPNEVEALSFSQTYFKEWPIFPKRIEKINHDIMKAVKRSRSIFFRKISDKLDHISNSEWTVLNMNIWNGKKCKSLKEFITYFDLFIPTLLSSGIGKTISDILSVPQSQIVEKLLKAGKLQDAETIAKAYKTDIVEYVLKNKEISHDFINHLLKPYPIVLMTEKLLNRENSIDSLSSPLKKVANVESSICYKILQIENDLIPSRLDEYDNMYQEGCSNNDLITLLNSELKKKPLNSENIVILSYRIPSSEFIEIVEKELPKLNLKEILEITQDAGCDYAFHEELVILEKASQRNITLFPIKNAFSTILEKKYFDLAKDFIRCFRNKLNLSSLIRREVINQLRASQSPQDYFDLVPELYNEIFESLPIRYRDILESKAPSYDDKIPDNWIKANDPFTLLKKNFDDTQNVLQFLETHPNINFDSDFVSIIKSTSFTRDVALLDRINKISHIINIFHHVFRSPEKVFHPASKQLIAFVNLMTVNDWFTEKYVASSLLVIKEEMFKMLSLCKMYNITSQFVDTMTDTAQIIYCLAEFSNYYLSTKYGIEYTFQNFTTKAAGEPLLRLCYQYDLMELAQRITSTYRLRDFECRENYAITCFSLGQFETGLKYSPNRRRSTSQDSAIQSTRFSLRVVGLFSVNFIYETDFIQAVENCYDVDDFMMEFVNPEECKFVVAKNRTRNVKSESLDSKMVKMQPHIGSVMNFRPGGNPPSPKRVTFNFAKNFGFKDKAVPSPSTYVSEDTPHFFIRIRHMCKVPECPPNENAKMLRHFLRTNAKVNDQVSYFVSCGNFEKALKIMREASYDQTRWNLFFNSIVLNAYAYHFESRFKYRIQSEDPTLSFFGAYFEKLLKFAVTHGMPHTQLDIELLLERTEKAALTAIKLATGVPIRESNAFLDVALNALDKEISGKKKVKHSLPNQLTTEKHKQLKTDVELQKSFNKFCLGNGFETNLNLFGPKSYTEAMVILLFKELQFCLAVRIMKHCQISPAAIGSRLIDMIMNEDENKIIEFLSNLSNECGKETFETMLSEMMMRLCFIHRNQELVFSLIGHCVNEPDFKCRLMIQFFQIEEALQIAKSCKLNHLLPLIGHSAQVTNLAAVASEVNRLLSREPI